MMRLVSFDSSIIFQYFKSANCAYISNLLKALVEKIEDSYEEIENYI